MSDEVGRVALGLDLNSSGFTKQISSIAKKAAATLASAFAVKGLVDFGKQCIELGSDLAEVQNVVDVTFPAMSAQVDKFAQSAASAFGLSETMAKKFTGTFGSMAEAFGFTEKEAYEMSTTLTGLAGDVASFYNISQDEAYTKLKSVFSGETETLKDLGIVMTQSALDAYALANGYGKTTSAMSEMEKVSLRYAFVQSQLTNATGDFWRTQDSWANQSRILALQAQSAMAAIGQGLINLLRPALVAINTVMARVVQLANAFKKLTEALFGSSGTAAATAANLSSADSSAASLSENLGNAVGELTGLSGSTGSAASGLGKASKAAQAFKRQLEGFDQITKVSEPESASSGNGGGAGSGGAAGSIDAGMDTSAVNAIADSTTAAEQSVSQLSKSMQQLLAPAVRAWNNLKNAFSAFASVVKSAGAWVLDNVLKPIGKWTISKAVPAVLNLLAAGFDVLTSVCKALAPAAQWVYETFLVPLGQWTGGIIVGVLETITGALKGLSDWIDRHQTAFSNIVLTIGAFAAAWKTAATVTTIISGVVTAVKTLQTAFSMASSVTALISGLTGVAAVAVPVVAGIAAVVAAGVLLYKNWDTIRKWAKELRDAIADVMDNIKKGIAKAWDNVKNTTSSTWKAIRTAVSDAISSVKNTVSSGLTSAKNTVASVWNGVKSATSSAWNAVKTAVSNPVNSIKSTISTGLSSAKSTVSSHLDSMKSKFSSVMTSTKNTVTNAISKIKGAFNFSWSLPKLKLPHFSVSGKFSLNPPSVPSFGIKWYKKAMDKPVLLNKPTLFGAGEAGPEVVAGAEKLKSMIGTAVQSAIAASRVSVDLSGYVQRNTPRLAAISSSEPAEERRLRQMVSAAQGTQDLDRLEALLKEILVLLKTLDIVSVDPESLRKYFIRKTNANTNANGGRCELKT